MSLQRSSAVPRHGNPFGGKNAPASAQHLVIDRVIQQIEHLPTLPQVVMRVLAMAESPKISAMELSKAMDQSLAAKVLKVANSAYYGGRNSKTINSIHHAIMMIGFETVKEIILTTSFFHTFHDSRDVEALQPLWQHSLECALIAKRLAWMYRYDSLDEAYLSGLTHDIGKLIIQQYFSKQYGEIEKMKESGIDPLAAEKEILTLTHAEIGAKVAERWAFPESLVEAIARHHDRKWEISPALGKILFYADRYTFALIDFQSMVEAFADEGMAYPSTWDTTDLASVEMILQEEMGKAKAAFGTATESEQRPGAATWPAKFS
ncbi:MAG TPA: HDOD domain-containing protein [Thermodesulfobacteriota bacterium]|nr:HDOD domain-containing protein [Thermodesulfobacteriota bacterium]